MRLILPAVAALSLGLAISAPVLADPADLCAAQAASPHEPGMEASGVDQFAMDVQAAIAACTAAVQLDPEDVTARARLSRAYYIGQQYDAMFPHVEIAAEAGNAMAQQLLGDSLVSGRGIAPDLERSIALLQASAAQDYAPGIYSLGLSYRFGEGVERDEVRAAELFARAGNKDLTWAIADLGVMTLYGDGIEQDVEEGIATLDRAAALGDSYAMVQLGHLYSDSDLVELDAPKALEYYLAADAAGDAEGTASAAYLYLGEYAGVDADLAEAERLARVAAQDEVGLAFYVLGFLAENDTSATADAEAALSYYQRGATLDDPLSIQALERLEAVNPQ